MRPSRVLGVVFALVLIACTVCSGVITVVAFREWKASRQAVFSTPGPALMETNSPTARPSATASPSDSDEAGLQTLLRRLEKEAETLRGLTAKRPVPHKFLTTEELRRKVEQDFFKDYSREDAFHDALELWALGMLSREFDLFHFYKKMYTDVIAGFYDDEEEVMYIVKDVQGFPAHARLTYVHEFVHALQDQYWDMEQVLHYDSNTCKKDTEYCAGVQALLEGDASHVEEQWFWFKATPQEKQEILQYYRNLENPVFDSAPLFMQKDLLFPYREGKRFVDSLYSRGGPQAVNQAFEHPPRSTEQILHPERYPEDVPVKVSLPDLPSLLGQEWQPVIKYNALGEFWIYLMLAYGKDPRWHLPEKQAAQAAEGWAGDAYALYYNKDRDAVAFVMDLRWDTPQDGEEFGEAMLRYLQARFGTGYQGEGYYEWTSKAFGLIRFAQLEPKRHLWAIAPEAHLLESLWRAFKP